MHWENTTAINSAMRAINQSFVVLPEIPSFLVVIFVILRSAYVSPFLLNTKSRTYSNAHVQSRPRPCPITYPCVVKYHAADLMSGADRPGARPHQNQTRERLTETTPYRIPLPTTAHSLPHSLTNTLTTLEAEIC